MSSPGLPSVFLGPDLLFLHGRRSDWTRIHLSDLILISPCLRTQSLSESWVWGLHRRSWRPGPQSRKGMSPVSPSPSPGVSDSHWSTYTDSMARRSRQLSTDQAASWSPVQKKRNARLLSERCDWGIARGTLLHLSDPAGSSCDPVMQAGDWCLDSLKHLPKFSWLMPAEVSLSPPPSLHQCACRQSPVSPEGPCTVSHQGTLGPVCPSLGWQAPNQAKVPPPHQRRARGSNR